MKKRLDVLLVEKGLVSGRDRAKAMVMAGLAFVDGVRADKPGAMLPPTAEVELRAAPQKYVSRGGQKLEKAIRFFSLKLAEKICMDIGASTGGFTDCMLQNGAARVYAVDVGYGQLAWRLRTDERVVVMERTNIRYVTAVQVPEPLDFASADVSFISLKAVLPVAYTLLRQDGEMVCLIKPQFEAGRGNVGKKGVVRDKSVHESVIKAVAGCAEKIGFSVPGLSYSPVKGPEGNIEYLMHIKKAGQKTACEHAHEIEVLVAQAHAELGGIPAT